MSTSNVPVLQADRAYLYCIRCEADGHEGIEMRRVGHRFVCPLQHELDIKTVNALVASGRKLSMVPLVINETPAPNMVKKEVWVHPQTWETIQAKFRGRLIVTLDVFFNLLANDGIIFVTGEDAQKLRTMGLNSGKDIVAMAEGRKEIEELHKALIQRLGPVFAAAQAASE